MASISIVTFGLAAMYSSATLCHRSPRGFSPLSPATELCHQVRVTGSASPPPVAPGVVGSSELPLHAARRRTEVAATAAKAVLRRMFAMIFLSVVVDLAEHRKSGTREAPASNDI